MYLLFNKENLLYAFDQWTGMDQYESNAFYYHSDHLGSSSLITDANGQLDQHYQYLPFSRRDCADVRSTTQLARPNPDEPSSELRQGGEPFVSQKMNTGVRFTFSGKERDTETDYSYFGARYYTSDLGVWLSVDPLAHLYASWSDYAYVGNNPINFVDPDGRFRTKFGAWWYKVWNGGDEIRQDKGGEFYVSTDASEVNGWEVTITSHRVFDKNGRSEGKDLELERMRERFIAEYNFTQSMNEMGIEVYRTESRTEAIRGMLKIPTRVVLPSAKIPSISLFRSGISDAVGGEVVPNENSPYLTVTKGNKTYHISPSRVKEYIRNPRNPNAKWGDQIDFKKYETPKGSRIIKGAGKGHKRMPTRREIKMYHKYVKGKWS